MGQQAHSGDVAHGPQALTGAQVRVDLDAALVERGAGRLQSEPGHARAPAGRHQKAVAVQFTAIVEDEDVVGTVAPRGDRLHVEE